MKALGGCEVNISLIKDPPKPWQKKAQKREYVHLGGAVRTSSVSTELRQEVCARSECANMSSQGYPPRITSSWKYPSARESVSISLLNFSRCALSSALDIVDMVGKAKTEKAAIQVVLGLA